MWRGVSILGLAALALAIPTAAQAQSYPLLCRGGPNMTIEARFELIIGGQTGTYVKIRFRPANQPGSVAKPGSGECTWIDRTLNAQEPSDFTMVAKGIGFSFNISGGGRVLEEGGQPVLQLGGASVSEREGYNGVVSAVLARQFFTVEVANDGQTLRVSAVRPGG